MIVYKKLDTTYSRNMETIINLQEINALLGLITLFNIVIVAVVIVASIFILKALTELDKQFSDQEDL